MTSRLRSRRIPFLQKVACCTFFQQKASALQTSIYFWPILIMRRVWTSALCVIIWRTSRTVDTTQMLTRKECFEMIGHSTEQTSPCTRAEILKKTRTTHKCHKICFLVIDALLLFQSIPTVRQSQPLEGVATNFGRAKRRAPTRVMRFRNATSTRVSDA